MKNIVFILFLFTASYQVYGQYLVKNGKTDFKIVLPDLPKSVEQTAAKELKRHLDQITNINWVIASEKEVPEKAPQILVGNSARAKKFFPEIDPERIPYDGIEIHLKNNKLLLTGHPQRGTLYAVNTFLEDVLGVRWWTSTEHSIPNYRDFKLNPLNISYAPKLFFRETHYKDAYEPVFSTQLKSNGHFNSIAPEYGGHDSIVYFCHSFFRLIPPKKYFADHPEWFSEINGVRLGKNENNFNSDTQLCLTNDEMRKELTKNAIETLRKHPNGKIISISQMDNGNYCTCEKCKQAVEEEGSLSGPIIRFVNQVAEEIEKEFPDVFVETLAYLHTRKAPKQVKPRHNVLIRLCTADCSFVQPLTGEQNQSFRNDMEQWSKIAPQLFVWNYDANFSQYILPHPNLRVLAPNIRFFVAHGVIGLFEQGDYHCPVGDFVRLRSWLISHLLWNPTLDENKLMREFLEGYYGKKATPFLLEYFDTLIDRAEASGKHIGISRENTHDWLDYETLCKATSVFDKAIAAAEQESGNNSEFVRRLRRERLPLEHVWLIGYDDYKQYAEQKGEPFSGPADPLEACRKFFATCETYQVNIRQENDIHSKETAFATYRDKMLRRFEKPVSGQ